CRVAGRAGGGGDRHGPDPPATEAPGAASPGTGPSHGVPPLGGAGLLPDVRRPAGAVPAPGEEVRGFAQGEVGAGAGDIGGRAGGGGGEARPGYSSEPGTWPIAMRTRGRKKSAGVAGSRMTTCAPGARTTRSAPTVSSSQCSGSNRSSGIDAGNPAGRAAYSW